MGCGIRGRSSDPLILCTDSAIAVDIAARRTFHAFLDDLDLLSQVAYGSSTCEGRPPGRTLDDFAAHSRCDSDLVEVSINNALSYQGFLERFHGPRGFFVYALLGRHHTLIIGLIDLRWTGTSQAAHADYGHFSYEHGYY